jgi:surface protein
VLAAGLAHKLDQLNQLHQMRTATSPPMSNLGDVWLPLLQAIIRNNQSEYSVTDDPGGASQKIESFEQAVRSICKTAKEYETACHTFLGDALVLVLQDEVEALHAERLPALWRATAAKLENANRTMREFDKEDAETGEPDEWNVWNVASRRNGVPALKLMDAVAKGRMRLKHDENVADFEVRAAHRMDQRVLHLSYKTALALLPHVFGIDKWADRFMAVYPKVQQWGTVQFPTEEVYGPHEAWDVSNVTNMSSMFGSASKFNRPIGAWNVSSVKDMKDMFSDARSFNQPIGAWNVSSVKDMSRMFQYAYNFNQPLEQWNVGEVTDMEAMFGSAQSFNQPIEEWKVNNVTDMNFMFRKAINFNQSIGTWNVSNVTDMSFMFAHTESFNQPLDGWKVQSGVNTYQMFYGAHFPQDPSRFEIFNSEDVVMGNA